MKRLTSDSSSKDRKYRQAHLTFAAFALLALQSAMAQSPLPAAVGSAPAPASAPTFAASAAEPLQRISPNKIAAPNALLPAPGWSKLSSAQKTALQPLEQDWDALDATRKSQWLEVATRFSALPAEEQLRTQERMREWAKLSPAERQQARIGFQGAKKINAAERQAKWEAYQALPPEQRQHLADKAAKKVEAQANKALNTSSNASKANSSAAAKSNRVLVATPIAAPKAVAPTLLQAKPGASTVLMTQAKLSPALHQAGNIKVLVDPNLLDSKTLLPKRQAIGASAP